MAVGTRYPTLAFHTGGAGQAVDGIPPQPFETFCYDSALQEAKIENFNIVPYTSVLPKELFGRILPVDTTGDLSHLVTSTSHQKQHDEQPDSFHESTSYYSMANVYIHPNNIC